jgi:hypothetical protein
MIYFVAAGLVLPLCLRRNPLTVLADVRLHAAPLIFLGLLIQFVIAAYVQKTGNTVPYAFEASFLLIMTAMILNREKYGFRPMIAGCTLNFFALLLNGGKMPVSLKALEIAGLPHLMDMSSSPRHQAMASGHVEWLGDWIPFFTPVGTNFVLSPGDILVGIGLILFIFRYSKQGRGSS